MMRTVDPGRLAQLRQQRGLTQEALAEKARLSKQTIYRLEKGRQSGNQQKSLERLCKALDVEADVLTGQRPLPPSEQAPSQPSDDSRYQLNVRLDGAIRNAFSLVALRYKIRVSRIVELAPLLFVLAAERSLDRRRAKLAELDALLQRGDELRSNFPHLPYSIAPCYEDIDGLREEQESIKRLDIFGEEIPGKVFARYGPVVGEYESAEHNPFVLSLKEDAAETPDLAEIGCFDGRFSTSYRVCREDTLLLTGGDEKLAKSILEGWVLLHEMPRQLLDGAAAADRTEWLRAKLEEWEEDGKNLEEMLQNVEQCIRDMTKMRRDREGAQL